MVQSGYENLRTYNFESNDNASEVPEECKNDGENTVKTKPSIRKSRLRKKNPIPEFTPQKLGLNHLRCRNQTHLALKQQDLPQQK